MAQRPKGPTPVFKPQFFLYKNNTYRFILQWNISTFNLPTQTGSIFRFSRFWGEKSLGVIQMAFDGTVLAKYTRFIQHS